MRAASHKAAQSRALFSHHQNLERIWIYVLTGSRGQYKRSLGACMLDERYVADPATSVGRIASTIVHEATHAKLERCGIEYREELRARIEAICLRRELAFAVRLPDSAQRQEEIRRVLDWLPANLDYFSDAQFSERRAKGEIEAFRYIGFPAWLTRVCLMLRSVIGRMRRLFRIAKPRANRG